MSLRVDNSNTYLGRGFGFGFFLGRSGSRGAFARFGIGVDGVEVGSDVNGVSFFSEVLLDHACLGCRDVDGNLVRFDSRDDLVGLDEVARAFDELLNDSLGDGVSHGGHGNDLDYRVERQGLLTSEGPCVGKGERGEERFSLVSCSQPGNGVVLGGG